MNFLKSLVKGDHIYVIYPDQTTKILDLISFIKTGIDNNELVFIMIDSLDIEEISQKIIKKNNQSITKDMINEDNILLTTTKEWFYPDGNFNTSRIIKRWEKVFLKVKKEKKGLRCFTDVSSFFIEGLENGLISYDKMLEAQLSYPFISVYAYKIEDIKKMNKQQLAMLYLNNGMIWAKD